MKITKRQLKNIIREVIEESINNDIKVGDKISFEGYDIGEDLKDLSGVVTDIRNNKIFVKINEDIPVDFNPGNFMTDDYEEIYDQSDIDNLKVGDIVGFQDMNGKEQWGKIIKLNEDGTGIINITYETDTELDNDTIEKL